MINYIERNKLSKDYLPDSKDIADFLKKENKWDVFNRLRYIRKGYLSEEYKPTKKEIISEIEKLNSKWDIEELLQLFKTIKGIDDIELLHYLNKWDVFTVTWYTIENVLDEELGEGEYDELYHMNLDDQIEFIENNTYFDVINLIEISIEQIQKSKDKNKFNEIKKNILDDIS